MAFTTVVSGQFYELMIAAIREIVERKGSFSLVMLLPSNTHEAQWNAVFSARWLDPLSLREAVKSMSEELKGSLSHGAFAKIQRVSILRTTESFVREVTSDLAIPITPGTAYRVQSFAFSRFGVDEAIILVADPPSQEHAHGSQIHNSR
ncbi:MAG: hypothetical protein ACJ71U_07850 [Terriglobales bacterium]